MDPIVFVIDVPMGHPAAEDSAADAVAANLRTNLADVFRFDAGGDFYQHYLLDPTQLQNALVVVNRRLDQGDYATASPQVGADRDRWQARIETAGTIAGRLCSDDFRDLSRVAADLLTIENLLELISAAFYPLGFARGRLWSPHLDSIADVAAFATATTGNPFADYAIAARPFGERPAPSGMAVCVVARPDQVGPAATLISHWRQRWPQTSWAACGPAPWVNAVHAALDIQPDAFSPDHHTLWRQIQSIWAETMPGESHGDAVPEDAIDGPEASIMHHRLHDRRMDDTLESARAQGRQTIVWHDPQGLRQTLARGLYQASREGFWNHLIVPADHPGPLAAEMAEYAADNPNIVHSWCRRSKPVSSFSSPMEEFPTASAPYGDTAPLPGIPIWQVLRDPNLITAFHRQLGLKTLMQLRYLAQEGQIIELGSNLAFHYSSPGDLPAGFLDEICRMVEAGGSVGTKWLRHNLERAFLIAYVQEHGVIVGNSSLKHPRDEYIEAVSAQSGIDLHDYLERGYTSVRPEYRGFGIGARLLAGLTERAGDYKIFSVIGEDNIATQKMAVRNQTRKVAAFHSQRVGKQVGVWIPEWMIPEGTVLPPQPQWD